MAAPSPPQKGGCPAWRKADVARSFIDGQCGVEVITGPLDDLAYAAIGFGSARRVTGNPIGNLNAGLPKRAARIGGMLEGLFEETWGVARLVGRHRDGRLALHGLQERAASGAFRFDKEKHNQALRLEGVRRVRRHDRERALNDKILKMKTEHPADRKRRLKRVMSVHGVARGGRRARRYVENPKASAFPKSYAASSDRRHRVIIR